MTVNRETDTQKIVLAGNPNVGKSVVFNCLTGFYVEVSNFPGTTVDLSKIKLNDIEYIDSPGIYGLGNYNEEEIVAKKIILEADLIINVVSAISLDRDLFLTQQLIDFDFPVIVVLNQLDEAASRGVSIDIDKLENFLGVKIISTIATKNIGINELKQAIDDKTFYKKGNKILFAENYSRTELAYLEENPEYTNKINEQRRQRVNNIVEEVVFETNENLNFSSIFGRIILNPIIGSIFALFVLFIMYQVIGVLVSGSLVDFLDEKFFILYYLPWINNIVSNLVHNSILNQILVGEFGLLTMAVQYSVGVLLPLVFSFYILISILEDSGYLPRLAVFTDTFLSKIGLNGKAIIPIILGFGCITMATITTRILGTSRERTIATIILGLAIPCSAQLGIIITLIALAGGLKFWIIYLFIIFIVMALIGTILNKLLPGKSSYLLIDLPPMRIPVLSNVFKKTIMKTRHFLEEAVPMFMLGSLFITFLKILGGITFLEKLFTPLTVNLLHLPKETAIVFIMGIVRRDFGAAGLAKLAGISGDPVLSPLQILVSLVVITLFVPCIIAVVVMFKERGWKEASFIWIGSWVVAFLIGGIVARLVGFIV